MYGWALWPDKGDSASKILYGTIIGGILFVAERTWSDL
jgi:hypothetical protein